MRPDCLLAFVLSALLVLSAGVPSVLAQDKPEAEVTETQSGEDTAEAAEAVDAEGDPQGDDDNFIPTEKINVDSSVSFPVDI